MSYTLRLTPVATALCLVLAGCNHRQPYDATGIFDATTVTVSAETPGRLLSLAPQEGDSVTAGQVLGTVDTATLVLQRNQLSHQQSALESTSPDLAAQAAALRAQIAHARSETARVERLVADKAATPKQLDDARAQVDVLRAQLEALLSTLGKNRSAVADNALALQLQREQVETQIARSTLRAPISGTVLTKYAQPGEYAAPGKPLYKLADLNTMYMRAYFTAEQLADLRLGQRVTVIADFGGDKQFEYPGTVSWIAQESEFTPKSIQTNSSRANLVYAVKIAVRNDGRLKLGQYGEVRLDK